MACQELTKSRLNVSMAVVSNAIVESIIHIIYPSICAGCRRPNSKNSNIEDNCWLCPDCYLGIKRHIPPFCLKCGRGLAEIKSIKSGSCPECANRQYHFQRAWSVCLYEGLIKELIHHFKYNQKQQYQIIFEKLFTEFIEAFKILRDMDLIIPIPLHPVRLREREYNQSQMLADIVSKIIQKPVAVDILERIHNTKPQLELNENDRVKNITGCFNVKNHESLKAKTVLLIDDVLTTGSTLSEAARIINSAAPQKIYALTLAS